MSTSTAVTPARNGRPVCGERDPADTARRCVRPPDHPADVHAHFAVGARRPDHTWPAEPPPPPAVGSLFVTPDGTAYRLRGYLTLSDPPEYPQYTLLPPNGLTGFAATTLPADARLVWAPDPERTDQ